jgi:NAD-dependent SIR2 family protein deacetylase
MSATRIFVITGAGISAESGIPTFRGSDGYWRNLDPAKLATPEAFEQNPKLVWEWYYERRRRIRSAKPNAAHDAVVRLSILAPDFLLVTQNVDDLHARAGLSKEKMVQIHGDIFETRCSRCDFSGAGRGGSPEPPVSRVIHANSGRLRSIAPTSEHEHDEIPRCPKCEALMRPGVVWFGEQLDPVKIDIVENYLRAGACDLVLVIGTTALFGYIVDWALRAHAEHGELIEINPEETPLSRSATQCIREPAAIALPKLVSALSAL